MKLAGVVPAAGRSTRMGEPKGLLRLEGETFVHRTARALVDGGCAPVFVVVAEGDEALAEEARRAGARVLRNPAPGEGPITSLRLAIEALAADTDGVVYLPLDHPLVTSAVVERLRTAAATHREPLTLVVHRGERGHPTAFGRELFDELLDPALQGGARTVVHRHLDEAHLVEVDDASVVTDIDTPDEYRAALDLASKGHA